MTNDNESIAQETTNCFEREENGTSPRDRDTQQVLSFFLNFLSNPVANVADAVAYLDEEYEMLERRVQVCLFSKLYDLGKVLMIDVGVHSEQSLQNSLCDRQEIFGERDSYKREREESAHRARATTPIADGRAIGLRREDNYRFSTEIASRRPTDPAPRSSDNLYIWGPNT